RCCGAAGRRKTKLGHKPLAIIRRKLAGRGRGGVEFGNCAGKSRMIPTVVGIILLLIFLITGFFLQRRRRAAFEMRFPPISDAEFMALCPPGTKPAIALKVRRILADQLGVEYERIYPSSRIV